MKVSSEDFYKLFFFYSRELRGLEHKLSSGDYSGSEDVSIGIKIDMLKRIIDNFHNVVIEDDY